MTAAGPGAVRFCPNCGVEVAEGQHFCRNCGADLTAAAGAVPAPPPAPPAPGAPPGAAGTRVPVAERAVETPVGVTPAPSATRVPGPPWIAWVGIVGCFLVAVGCGTEWIGVGSFSADGFDVPLATLFTDTATGGIPIAALLLVAVAFAVVVALIAPETRPLSMTFLAAGAVCAVFVLWYVVRAMSQETVEGTTTTSFGVWLAVIGSIVTIVSGFLLMTSRPRATA